MRTLREIAREILSDWVQINNSAARDALDHMKNMGSIEASYGADPNGYAVVGQFLANAKGWHGTTADRVRMELRTMCGHPRP